MIGTLRSLNINLVYVLTVPPSSVAVISAFGSGPSLLLPGDVASGNGTSSSELSAGSRMFLSLVLLFPPFPISAYVPLSLPFCNDHFTGDSNLPFAWFSLLSSSITKKERRLIFFYFSCTKNILYHFYIVLQ